MDIVGTFLVEIKGKRTDQTVEDTAVVYVRTQGRSVIKDDEGEQFYFPAVSAGHKGESISLPHTLELPTDVTTGQSTELGYTVTVTTRYEGSVTYNFAARAASTTPIPLTSLGEDIITPVSDAVAFVTAAQAAAADAEDHEIAAEAAAAEAAAFAGTNNTQVAGMVTGAGPTKDALSATFAPLGTTTLLDDLATPIYAAHRGGQATAPENTMEAFRAAVAVGVPVLEMDVWRLGDGSLVVMHDSTVDRTTSSTGNVTTHSATSWQLLAVDGGPSYGAAWPASLKAPLFEDVVREFGNRVVLAPELKGGGTATADAVIAMLRKYGVRGDGALVQSFFLASLAPVVASEYRTAFLPAAETPASIAAAGVDWVIIASSAVTNAASITQYQSVGLKVCVYDVTRRQRRDELLGFGVDMILSDEAEYLASGLTLFTDPFKLNTIPKGLLEATAGTGKGSIVGGKWVWGDTTATYRGAIQGWGSPIYTNNYSITFTVDFDAVTATDRWASVWLAATDDRTFDDNSSADENGYHVLMRANGGLTIFRRVAGVTTQIATGSAASVTVPGSITCKIDVTGTVVRVTRTDVEPDVVVSATDSTYQPDYFAFGRAGASVKFHTVAVTYN